MSLIISYEGRTGSNYLVALLNQHPEIHCALEIFNGRSLHLIDRREPIEKYIKDNSDNSRRINGFKFNTDHRELLIGRRVFNKEKVDRFFNQGHKVIHSFRDDLLSQYVSLQIAKKTKRWGISSSQDITTERIAIDVSKIAGELEEMGEFRRKQCHFWGGEIHNVKYENLIDDTQTEMDKVFDYLGVSRIKINTEPGAAGSVKQERRELNRIITNYDEVMKCLK